MSEVAESATRFEEIRLVVTDVDGVLTTGGLHYGADGERLKVFHVHDGKGIAMLVEAGIEVAVITARESKAVETRMRQLGVKRCVTGCKAKGEAIGQMMAEIGIEPRAVAYIGDDVQDLPAMREVGLSISVADAVAAVRSQVHWVTSREGGRGAFREVADRILASRSDDAALEFDVVIPARYGSTRLEGKPLRIIAGKPMIQHVWDKACAAGAGQVVVATDDERILQCVEGFGARACMTRASHVSGTDRLAEVVEALEWDPDRIVVNLQGDEPGMPPGLLRLVARSLVSVPQASMSTVATPITEARELFNPNAVKVVLRDDGLASYFSRAPIPWVRDAFAELDQESANESLPDGFRFLRHLGLYAYRVDALKRLASAPSNEHERAESLEQLRALALGIGIHVAVVPQAPPPGVDTEADLKAMEQVLLS